MRLSGDAAQALWRKVHDEAHMSRLHDDTSTVQRG